MALPSSLVEPVNILQQKHMTTSEDLTQNNAHQLNDVILVCLYKVMLSIDFILCHK